MGQLAGHSWVRQAVGDGAPGVCGGAEYEGGTENRSGTELQGLDIWALREGEELYTGLPLAQRQFSGDKSYPRIPHL